MLLFFVSFLLALILINLGNCFHQERWVCKKATGQIKAGLPAGGHSQNLISPMSSLQILGGA